MAEMPRFLTASAEIALSSPEEIMLKLCAHFREHGDVTVEGKCGRIETGFGTAGFEACERCLKVFAEGEDDTALAYVKLAVAEHLLHFAAADKPTIRWQGDGVAGQPLPYFREMRVVRTVDVTPHVRRLTLAGNDLRRFASGGIHVRLLLPRSKEAPPAWPVTGEDGRPSWPGGHDRPHVRIYTLRRVDAERGEVDIDFVIHEGDAMPGARFGAEARPGDVIGMTGPGGGSAGQADWYLFAGDETALPAIARILEELPATAHAVVRIEVADMREEQPLTTSASLDLRWLHRNGRDAGRADLLPQAVRDVKWPNDGRSVFGWAGCAHGDFRAIRSYFRQELKLAREEHLAVAYWRPGFDGDDARRES
jgi:NADPH-dependent ferric siderophore reductase